MKIEQFRNNISNGNGMISVFIMHLNIFNSDKKSFVWVQLKLVHEAFKAPVILEKEKKKCFASCLSVSDLIFLVISDKNICRQSAGETKAFLPQLEKLDS